MTLSLTTIVPGTIGALAKGCVCPGRFPGNQHAALLLSDGLLFDPRCPVHRHAVETELQRMFGRPQ